MIKVCIMSREDKTYRNFFSFRAEELLASAEWITATSSVSLEIHQIHMWQWLCSFYSLMLEWSENQAIYNRTCGTSCGLCAHVCHALSVSQWRKYINNTDASMSKQHFNVTGQGGAGLNYFMLGSSVFNNPNKTIVPTAGSLKPFFFFK